MVDGKCPLCKMDGCQTIYRHDLISCTNCGMVYDRSIWEKNAAARMVDDWFECASDENKRGFWVSFFERLNNKRTWSRIKRYNIKVKGKYLDIGIGSGSLLEFMGKKGFIARGCDLSKATCDRVFSLYKIHAVNGPVSDIPEQETFDVITMNHVLEHSDNPIEMLADVRKRTGSEGIVHIAVPNLRSWDALLPGWVSYQPYHLLYFTHKTLQDLIERAGFSILSISTHESFSGWFLAILRTCLACLRRNQGALKGKPQNRGNINALFIASYRLAMFLCGLVTLPLRAVQGRLGYGDELIAIVRKAQGQRV